MRPLFDLQKHLVKSNVITVERHLGYATQKTYLLPQTSTKESCGWLCAQMQMANQQIMEFLCGAVYEAHHACNRTSRTPVENVFHVAYCTT